MIQEQQIFHPDYKQDMEGFTGVAGEPLFCAKTARMNRRISLIMRKPNL